MTANSDIPKCSLSDLARFGMIQDSEITVSESRAPAPPSVPQPKPVVNKTASTPASASVPKPVPRTTQTKEVHHEDFAICNVSFSNSCLIEYCKASQA